MIMISHHENYLCAQEDLSGYIPKSIGPVDVPQTAIPRIAKDQNLTKQIEEASKSVPTSHTLYLANSCDIEFFDTDSIHLVVTSPPYWNLKKYNQTEGQLGEIANYQDFLSELDRVWKFCYRALVPGGRLICVVGDVCLSRRKNHGRHTVVPLHSSIQEHCRKLGYDNLAPIIWYKIANATYEVENGSNFLGKPYEPNSIIKNDIEYILMLRKSGGYRKPSLAARILSVISTENHKKWFKQIWPGPGGASTRQHPAPFPLELAERLIRMYSFVGDTILDPFMGTGTTNLAAANWGRNSIGIEIDQQYFELTRSRLEKETKDLFTTTELRFIEAGVADG